MAIPDFQTLMLPLLKMVDDSAEHSAAEIVDSLAHQFQLTEDERRELLPSGKQSRFNNRVAWARAYLKMARLIESTGRGRFRITLQGRGVLKNPPPKIDIKFLMRFPDFATSRLVTKRNGVVSSVAEERLDIPQTPEETLDSVIQSLRADLARDLLERVKSALPTFFEHLVVELLLAMGYGGTSEDAGQVIGHSGDEGIDGTIKEDKLGLDVIYIQAKRWEGTVGRPVVQAFVGSLEGMKARKGVLITTSQFSKDALEYVQKIERRVVLIDGERLAQLMIDHGIGVSLKNTYVVKRIDQDYFSEE